MATDIAHYLMIAGEEAQRQFIDLVDEYIEGQMQARDMSAGDFFDEFVFENEGPELENIATFMEEGDHVILRVEYKFRIRRKTDEEKEADQREEFRLQLTDDNKMMAMTGASDDH